MKLILENRKARFEYSVLETWEAGIVLTGLEVKSLRLGKSLSIAEAWVQNINEELVLTGAHFETKAPEWMKANPRRNRKLLLHKRQIRKIIPRIEEGLTLVPLKFYFNERNLVKVQIGLVKGKKLYDKRQKIKDRDLARYGMDK